VLFPSGKAELNEAGLETLNAVAEAIKNLKDRRIRIEGHTDSVPVGKKSEFASNWELSSARALAVTRYLQDLGVDPSRMSAEARSQYAPAVSNKSRTGRARNRRIEIYLVPLPAGAAAKFKTEE
jgi:chemotaxis protein MotB